jgi:hypothetical protein
MKKHHDIGDLKFEGDFLVITIDGQENRFPLGTVSPLIEKASEKERDNFEISPAGYGIHWPQLDEDISIDGLLGIIHAPEQRKRVTYNEKR